MPNKKEEKQVEEKAIVKQESRATINVEGGKGIVFNSFDGMQRFATAAVAAGFWKDCSTVAKATMKLEMGAEVGLKPIQSLNRIHIIEGKPSIAAEAMAGLVRASGKYRLVEIENTEDQAVVMVKERVDGTWEDVGTGRFSAKEAAAAGLGGRHVWKAYKSDMLWARAVSRACRRHCSDVVLGLYAVEDFDLTEGDLKQKQVSEDQAANILAKSNVEYRKSKESSSDVVEAEIVVDSPKPKKRKAKKKTHTAIAEDGGTKDLDMFGNEVEDDDEMDAIISEAAKKRSLKSEERQAEISF